MTTISLVATDQLLSIAVKPKVASGDQNSVELHVDFDSKWDSYGKSAVFYTSDNDKIYEIPLIFGNCVIPHEVLAKPGTLYIGIRGVNADNNAVKTSSLVKYKISEGAPRGEGTTVEPTADVYQQILTAYEKNSQEIKDYVDSMCKPRAGFIYPLATETVPVGFLLCDGAEYSRSEYAELFDAIGETYGAGDGSTTFNVPNLSTRVPVGVGGVYNLGEMGGSATQYLTVNQMPKHSHTWSASTSKVAGSNNSFLATGDGTSHSDGYYSTTGTSGEGQPFSIMQPYTVVNYIIATGKGENVGYVVANSASGDVSVIDDNITSTEKTWSSQKIADEIANIPSGGGGGSYPAVESTDYPGCYYMTVNGEAEWLNPPMMAGVEYRTTERYDGKVVYAKYIGARKGTTYGNVTLTVGSPIMTLVSTLVKRVKSGGVASVSDGANVVSPEGNPAGVISIDYPNTDTSNDTFYITAKYCKD